jgi:hypothetical protein
MLMNLHHFTITIILFVLISLSLIYGENINNNNSIQQNSYTKEVTNNKIQSKNY